MIKSELVDQWTPPGHHKGDLSDFQKSDEKYFNVGVPPLPIAVVLW